MDATTIIARIRRHESELKSEGIDDFDQSRRMTLIGRVHLENRLSDILGLKADLADGKMLRPEVLEKAERESLVVF